MVPPVSFKITPVVLLLAGSAYRPQAQAESQDKPRPVRVMTYNIKHGQTNTACTRPPPSPGQPPSADCNLDLAASVEVMKEHGADIIGVQEVDRHWARSGYLDEPARLAAALGIEHYCPGANLDHAPDTHANVAHQYGTVILSRFPILECENRRLPRTAENEQRGLTRALVDVRGVPLQFYNTHLHTTAADRLLQTADIAAVMDAAGETTRVLTGDFNASPTAVEMQPILLRFRDAWREAPVPTPDNPNGFTSPSSLAGDPTSRIDYVFVSPDIQVSRTWVPIDARTRVAADHYPVVADLTLPGSPALAAAVALPPGTEVQHGGVVRGPRGARRMALLFTGHEYAEGGTTVLESLSRHQARATFFLTGDFLRNPEFAPLVTRIVAEGHELSPHSDRHLLYCSWEDRRTLVTRDAFRRDLAHNLAEVARFAPGHRPRYFEPPYEWFNSEIAGWSAEMGLQVVGYTPGTRSNADYTGESDPRFVSSEAITRSILEREAADPDGLNGFLLLMHVGAGPGRKDKMHTRLDGLLSVLAGKGYSFVTVDELLGTPGVSALVLPRDLRAPQAAHLVRSSRRTAPPS